MLLMIFLTVFQLNFKLRSPSSIFSINLAVS